MPEWSQEQEKEALAAITSLKFALGIPNHPTKADAFEERRVHIYTPDEESATLLAELLYRYGTGNRAAFYRDHPERLTIRDTIRVEPLKEGGFDATMAVPWPLNLKKSFDKMIKKYGTSNSNLQR